MNNIVHPVESSPYATGGAYENLFNRFARFLMEIYLKCCFCIMLVFGLSTSHKNSCLDCACYAVILR